MSSISARKLAAKNAAGAERQRSADHTGPIDVLLVSPPSGLPWFIYFKKEQLSHDGPFIVLKKYIKQYNGPENDHRWVFSFEEDRWFSVRRPSPHSHDPHARHARLLTDRQRRTHELGHGP